MNHLKNVMQEIPEKELEERTEMIDEDSGLLELATDGGREVNKEREYYPLSTVFVILKNTSVLTQFY
jgi:hypothetical protein